MKLIRAGIKNMDVFTRNIILVFAGTSLASFLNLLFQLFVAHKFSPVDFAAFNSLLGIFVIITMPLVTLHAVLAKYTAGFLALGEKQKTAEVLSGILKVMLAAALLSVVALYFLSPWLFAKLKIEGRYLAWVFSLLIGVSCILPVFSGAIQGLERFNWYVSASLLNGLSRLLLVLLFVFMGYRIGGALGAILLATFLAAALLYFPLRGYLSLRYSFRVPMYKEMLAYILPVGLSLLCYFSLVNLDMVLVKYYFTPADSGTYSLAQMVGKIFLFLPATISIVMFPKTSGLKARDKDTSFTARRSIFYGSLVCLCALLAYNLFPGFALKLLTGKVFAESILLGRLFSVSMSFFALAYILIWYFLSVNDLRFVKYLVILTVLQVASIMRFHGSLINIQMILCINSAVLFLISFGLAFFKPKRGTVVK